MEPVLLGLAAPSLLSTATAVSRAASTLTKPFAAMLLAASNPTSGFRNEATPLEGLRAQADRLQEDLERRMSEVIENSGISIDSPVRLKLSDADAALEVDAGDPQRTVLEAAFASDPSIASDFRKLATVRKLLSAADANLGSSALLRAEQITQAEASFEAELLISPVASKVHLRFD